MKVDLIVGLILWLLVGMFPAVCPADTMLQMSILHDAIYTPGNIRIDVTVTQAAQLAGPYDLRVTAGVARQVVHERTMMLLKGSSASCELSFPEVRIVTEVRCRAELFIGHTLLEACEKPVRLWPRRCLQAVTHDHPEFWAFDASGVVQQLLFEVGIAATNAAFQIVRDFGTPRVVFVGESVDPTNIRMILDRVGLTDEDTVVVLLRQEQSPEGLQVAPAQDKDPCDSVVWERAGLLKGLAAREVMGLLQGANPVHLQEKPGRSITSYLTGRTRDHEEVYSYLCVVQEENRRVLYCQLPSTDRQDPRQMALFRNLVQFACERRHSTTPPEATDTERMKP